MQSPYLHRLRLCLLFLFCGATLSVSTSIIQRNYLREGTLQATETLQKKWSRRTEFESLKVNKKILDFGLHIKAVTGIHITAPKIKHDWVQQGCESNLETCSCTAALDPKDKTYSFTMRGAQTDADVKTNGLIFGCKGITFSVPSTGDKCTCDINVDLDHYGYGRRLDYSCEPYFCLDDMFEIKGKKSKIKDVTYPACCDKQKICPSWHAFKRGFENPDDDSHYFLKYGSQCIESDDYEYHRSTRGAEFTWDGYKWFFGLEFDHHPDIKGEIYSGKPRLSGRWAPSSSGGQASFSQSMTWESGETASDQSSVNAAVSVGFEASYGVASVSVAGSHAWGNAVAKTNSDTSGGSKSRTCAAYQCEGGTTWQWQMTFLTQQFKTKFDNCLFVCTPNQGIRPKCPFGSCCSAEDRKDECATCSVLWCDPEEKGCPFNPAHDDHELYCGPSNKDYVDFLKILRSRVESWSRNTEKENEAMRVLQQQNKIKSETFKMLQKAFAHFQHATALIHGGRQAGCKENSDSAPDLAKKNCAACQVTNDACVGNPVGVATADKLDTTNWCGDNCAIAAPKKLPNKAAEANIMSKVKAMLSKLTLEVMEGNAQEAENYRKLAHSQASPFDYEAGLRILGDLSKKPKEKKEKKTVDPCAGSKTAEIGSANWCLCDDQGKIRWSIADDKAVQAVLEAEAKKDGDTKGKETQAAETQAADTQAADTPAAETKAAAETGAKEGDAEQKEEGGGNTLADYFGKSRCNNKGDKDRHEKCEWKGDEADGSCCSKEQGCVKHPEVYLHTDRKYFEIADIDLAPEDFTFPQLVAADKKLRLECYYKDETKEERKARIRRKEIGKVKAGAGTIQEYTAEAGSKEEQEIRVGQRNNLFMCFRRFYLDNKEKFTLQKIDQILVSEDVTCQDRLVNKDCIPKWGRIRAIDNLALRSVGVLQGGDFAQSSEELRQEKLNYLQEMHEKARDLIYARNKRKQKAARESMVNMKIMLATREQKDRELRELKQKLAREAYLRVKAKIDKKKAEKAEKKTAKK